MPKSKVNKVYFAGDETSIQYVCLEVEPGATMGVGTALNLRTHAQIIATVSVVNPNVLVWPVENRDPQEIDQALAEMGRVLNIDTAMIQGMHYEGIHPVSEVVLP